jgi:hypothetical protein
METTVHDGFGEGCNFIRVTIPALTPTGIRGALDGSMLPNAFSDDGTAERQQIGNVRSDSTPDQWYEIWRVGRTTAEGGTGARWLCSCPSRRYPCKHLNRLWAREHDADAERLTTFGASLLPSRAEKEAAQAQLEREMEARAVAARSGGRPVLYTIGHGSRDLEGFLAQLRSIGVALLVDVRTFPSSRWSKQFDKSRLSQPAALGKDMHYRHMPELGGYNRDKTARTKDDDWKAGIRWLADRARRETLAVFCMETNHLTCHRHQTIEPDLRVVAPDLAIVHLLPPIKPRSVTNHQLGLLS